MPYMANGSLLQLLKQERNNIVILEETDEDEVIYQVFRGRGVEEHGEVVVTLLMFLCVSGFDNFPFKK